MRRQALLLLFVLWVAPAAATELRIKEQPSVLFEDQAGRLVIVPSGSTVSGTESNGLMPGAAPKKSPSGACTWS